MNVHSAVLELLYLDIQMNGQIDIVKLQGAFLHLLFVDVTKIIILIPTETGLKLTECLIIHFESIRISL
jgi:hypothetical protein